MGPAVMVVAQLVAGVSPGDDREAEDIRSTLAWMQRTGDAFRRSVETDVGSGSRLLFRHARIR